MRSRRLPVLLPGEPPEFLVHDEQEPCPYLDGEIARLPFRVPVRALDGAELDARLALGDRRNGPLLYRPECPSCRACEAIRIDVDRFAFSASHRRTLRKGDRAFRVEIGPPTADARRVTLYNRHLVGRGLARTGPRMDIDGYRHFLAETCCHSFELRYLVDGELMAVAVGDRGRDALSAVYCYYDPEISSFSPGKYSILKQIELCRRWGLRYLYLGLYVEGSPAMAYKARFFPHERRVNGRWLEFERP